MSRQVDQAQVVQHHQPRLLQQALVDGQVQGVVADMVDRQGGHAGSGHVHYRRVRVGTVLHGQYLGELPQVGQQLLAVAGDLAGGGVKR